jgi:hypothetical protein
VGNNELGGRMKARIRTIIDNRDYDPVIYYRKVNELEINDYFDLRNMFYEYDRVFFKGQLIRKMKKDSVNLSFRTSAKMTSVGGKVSHRRSDRKNLELTLSIPLAYESENLVTSGIVCENREEVVRRVFEHELIHVMELVYFSDSSCSATRFKLLAHGYFGHTKSTHELSVNDKPQKKEITLNSNFQIGDKVIFKFRKTFHEGIITNITNRATVRTNTSKFYVPLNKLERK